MLDKHAGPAHASPPPGAPPSGHRTEPTLSVGAVLGILRRRLWPLLACTVLIPACALIALKQLTPRYTATGTLIYEPNEYKPRELQSILRVDPTTESVMASQAEILQGLRLIEPMAQRLNLADHAEFNPALRRPSLLVRLVHSVSAALFDNQPAPRQTGPPIASSNDSVLLAAQRATDVRPINASHVLEVSFTSEDPVLAAAAVNTLMDIYVKAT
ncbi:MAG: Wzz/FepE/Etk N-terminal domain-containing protein, partial [Acetobacteraceae bacterium]